MFQKLILLKTIKILNQISSLNSIFTMWLKDKLQYNFMNLFLSPTCKRRSAPFSKLFEKFLYLRVTFIYFISYKHNLKLSKFYIFMLIIFVLLTFKKLNNNIKFMKNRENKRFLISINDFLCQFLIS